MTTARLFVRGIVVTDGRSPVLSDVLAAVAQQTFAPDALHIVTVGDVSIPGADVGVARTTVAPAGSDLSAAVDAVLAEHPAHENESLWLLHDDSAPMPEALGALAATARKRRRAGIIGAAQVRWKDTSRLISLGSSVSRFGARRVDLIDDHDINQGQYALRDDVLAVSLAGALVRREVWEDLGGLDPAYRGFGDSADFCRLVWRSGRDVVVVPAALIRHRQLNLRGARDDQPRTTRASYRVRRTGEWYHALVWNRLWAVPLVLAWALGSSVARAVLRIAQNDAKLIGADLAVPWSLLTRLPSLPRSRARVRRHATVPRSVVRPLLVEPGEVLNYLRTRYLRAYDRWRTSVTPTGHVREELAAAGKRRRWTLALVVALGLAASIGMFGAWIPELLAGRALVGDVLGVTDIPWRDLWDRTWTGWSEDGYGAASLDGAFAALMLPFAAAPGGMRLWLGLLLALAPAVAAIGGWFAAGAATRSTVVRALAALVYGLSPLFLVSISQGRVGAVLAHLALPWFALGVARAFGWHRGEALADGDAYIARRVASPSAAAGASLALVVATVASPALLVPAIGLLALAAVLAGKRWYRALLIAVPSLVVGGAGLVAALDAASVSGLRGALEVMAREPGPAAASAAVEPWRLAVGLGHTEATGGWYASPGVAAALGIVIILAVVVALASGRAVAATRVGLLAVAVGLITAAGVQYLIVRAADGSGGAAANGWPGAGMSLALLGALAAATAASSGAWFVGQGRARAWRRTASAAALLVVTAVIMGHAAAWSWPSRSVTTHVHPAEADALPLVAALEQQPPTRARVLVLSEDGATVTYAVESADGHHALEGAAFAASTDDVPAGGTPSPDDLAGAVGELVGAGDGADQALAQWGIGVLVVDADARRAAAGPAQSETLSLMGASQRGTSYRVQVGEVGVSRAWVETPEGQVPVAVERTSGALTKEQSLTGTLVLAVPSGSGWYATLNGSRLEPSDDTLGRAAWTVPPVAGTLVIGYEDAEYRRWWLAGALVVGWALLASIPLHDRRFLGARS